MRVEPIRSLLAPSPCPTLEVSFSLELTSDFLNSPSISLDKSKLGKFDAKSLKLHGI